MRSVLIYDLMNRVLDGLQVTSSLVPKKEMTWFNFRAFSWLSLFVTRMER